MTIFEIEMVVLKGNLYNTPKLSFVILLHHYFFFLNIPYPQYTF